MTNRRSMIYVKSKGFAREGHCRSSRNGCFSRRHGRPRSLQSELPSSSERHRESASVFGKRGAEGGSGNRHSTRSFGRLRMFARSEFSLTYHDRNSKLAAATSKWTSHFGFSCRPAVERLQLPDPVAEFPPQTLLPRRVKCISERNRQILLRTGLAVGVGAPGMVVICSHLAQPCSVVDSRSHFSAVR